jgi:hypothetical protein
MPFFGSLRKGSSCFGLICKASMVGFSLLSRSYYYLRRRSPAPPFPPDHRQAGERGAIIIYIYIIELLPRISKVFRGKVWKVSSSLATLLNACEAHLGTSRRISAHLGTSRHISESRSVIELRGAAWHISAQLGASRSHDQSHRPAGCARTRLTGGLGRSLERH